MFKAAVGVSAIDYQIFRYFLVFTVSMILAFFSGLKPLTSDFPSELKWTVFWRSMTGQIAFFLYNYCLTLIPMTYVVIIFQTAGFWASLLAFFFMKERLHVVEIVGLVICFTGVVAITLNGSKNSPDKISLTDNVPQREKIMGFLLVFAGAWIYAACCVLNRALKSVNPIVVLFYHGLCGLLIGIFVVLLEYWFFTPSDQGMRILSYDAQQYAYLTGAMIFDSIQCFGQTIAF